MSSLYSKLWYWDDRIVTALNVLTFNMRDDVSRYVCVSSSY